MHFLLGAVPQSPRHARRADHRPQCTCRSLAGGRLADFEAVSSAVLNRLTKACGESCMRCSLLPIRSGNTGSADCWITVLRNASFATCQQLRTCSIAASGRNPETSARCRASSAKATKSGLPRMQWRVAVHQLLQILPVRCFVDLDPQAAPQAGDPNSGHQVLDRRGAQQGKPHRLSRWNQRSRFAQLLDQIVQLRRLHKVDARFAMQPTCPEICTVRTVGALATRFRDLSQSAFFGSQKSSAVKGKSSGRN